MPGMVMQMPGRHVSLSQPFLMDQIIQTPLWYNSSSVRYMHMDPERALLFPNANSSGIFHETCHHEKSPFLGTGLHGPSCNLKSTIAACSRHTILTQLKHCMLQDHIWERQSLTIKPRQVRKTRSDKAHSVTDGLYPHVSQVTVTTYWICLYTHGFMGYCCLI